MNNYSHYEQILTFSSLRSKTKYHFLQTTIYLKLRAKLACAKKNYFLKPCDKIRNVSEIMTGEEILLEKFKVLPENRRRELLNFAEFLAIQESTSKVTSVDSAIEQVFSRLKVLLEKLA